MVSFCLIAIGLQGAHVATLRLVAEGFVSPTGVGTLDPKQGLLYVADQNGVVSLVERDGSLREEPWLDLRSRMVKLNDGFDERGLLGLALHPTFATSGKFYVSYSAPKRTNAPAGWDCTTRISEFTAKPGTASKVDLATERVLLEIDKPYFNHNGGCLAFGPDQLLYISVGDGGNANGQGMGHSPVSNGQDLNTLLGKILRIDVNQPVGYGIPKDNPYAGGGGRPEIFAYGFRNPWRMSFDRAGEYGLLVGDIGQTLYEEVNRVVRGGNYGWFIREGRHCFDPKNANVALEKCADRGADGKPLIDPVIEYKNPNGFRNDPESGGISVMGGYVYRGKTIPGLVGTYLFGDWSKNWALPEGLLFVAQPAKPSAAGMWPMEKVSVAIDDGAKWKAYITGFGEDAEGELYVHTNGGNGVVGRTGKVYKLIDFK